VRAWHHAEVTSLAWLLSRVYESRFANFCQGSSPEQNLTIQLVRVAFSGAHQFRIKMNGEPRPAAVGSGAEWKFDGEQRGGVYDPECECVGERSVMVCGRDVESGIQRDGHCGAIVYWRGIANDRGVERRGQSGAFQRDGEFAGADGQGGESGGGGGGGRFATDVDERYV
jgi:hypothetical protein